MLGPDARRPQTEPAVNHCDDFVFKHESDLLVGPHFSFFEPLHIDRRPDHAVRIVPGQVRLHQMVANDCCFRRFATSSGEDLGDEFLERLGAIAHDGWY